MTRHRDDHQRLHLHHCPGVIYPYSSFYPSLPADMTTEMSGWEVSAPCASTAGWTTVPDGFYASAFLRAGGVTIEADERCAQPSTRTPCSGNPAFLDEVDHNGRTKWGLARRWATKLTESGLGIDAYMGPMFRGINRTFVMEGYTNEEARDIVRQRIQQRYWMSPDPASTTTATPALVHGRAQSEPRLLSLPCRSKRRLAAVFCVHAGLRQAIFSPCWLSSSPRSSCFDVTRMGMRRFTTANNP